MKLAGAIPMALAVFCVCALPLPKAAAEEPGAEVAKAASIRLLQSELMVAALACKGDIGQTLAQKYNAFVRHFSPALIRSADTLRAHFRKTHGAAHAFHFDAFLTALANHASLTSIRETAYCQSRARLAETALGLKDAELEGFSVSTYTTVTANLLARETEPAASATRLVVREVAAEAD